MSSTDKFALREIGNMIDEIERSCLFGFNGVANEKNGARRFAMLWPLAEDALHNFMKLSSQDRTDEIIGDLIFHGRCVAETILNPPETPAPDESEKDKRILELESGMRSIISDRRDQEQLISRQSDLLRDKEGAICERDTEITDLKNQIRALKAQLTKAKKGK